MARQMTATETKTNLLALLDEVVAGEEVVITRHGRVVARLVPANSPRALRGEFAHVALTAAREDELFATGETWAAS